MITLAESGKHGPVHTACPGVQSLCPAVPLDLAERGSPPAHLVHDGLSRITARLRFLVAK